LYWRKLENFSIRNALALVLSDKAMVKPRYSKGFRDFKKE
jgi:hypothetical protein